MRIHGRTRLLIGALAAAFVVAAPGTAFAGHDLGIYKVEQQVDLTSDDTRVSLSCNPGDIVLDGMWRIDHADYDEDDTSKSFLGRAVDVQEAFPKDTNADNKYDAYEFYFLKNAFGRAQVKVFATCMGAETGEANGHQHTIPVAPLTPATGAAGAGTMTCTGNRFIATPGFKIDPRTDDDPYVGRLTKSWPTNLKTWDWQLDMTDDPTATVTFYASCVNRKLPLAGGEKHKLVYKLQGPEAYSLPAGKTKTRRIECKSAYKAIVAGFSLGGVIKADETTDDGTFSLPNFWFLGMDPQPKNRDFQFLNSSGAVDPNAASLKAICLNYRTT